MNKPSFKLPRGWRWELPQPANRWIAECKKLGWAVWIDDGELFETFHKDISGGIPLAVVKAVMAEYESRNLEPKS